MAENQKKSGFKLLMVEDNPGDIALLLRVLHALDSVVEITVAEDGEAALSRLLERTADGEKYIPDLILLDLNLPKKSGWEVLVELKQDPTLRYIPVLVMTSSSAPKDVLRGYELRASAYLRKPMGIREFREAAQSIEKFWFDWAHLPTPILQREGP